MLGLYVICFLFLSERSIFQCYCTLIKFGFLLNSRDHDLDQTHLKLPVDIALERVHRLVKDGDYLNMSFEYVFKETTPYCSSIGLNNAGGKTVELYLNDGVTAFFGPPCSYQTMSTSDLTAYWNLPVISGTSTSLILEDKTRFSTLTRTSFRTEAMAMFVRRLFEHFKWKRCAIIKGSGDSYHNAITIPNVLEVLESASILSHLFHIQSSRMAKQLLLEVSKKARGKV